VNLAKPGFCFVFFLCPIIFFKKEKRSLEKVAVKSEKKKVVRKSGNGEQVNEERTKKTKKIQQNSEFSSGTITNFIVVLLTIGYNLFFSKWKSSKRASCVCMHLLAI
jgi:hypothetical protein